MDKVIGTPAARATYRKAKDALHEQSEQDRKAGRHDESDEFTAANDAVIAAEQNIPAWRRS
jgi:hypothetical protein